MLTAKTVVFAAVVLVAMTAASFAAFFGAQLFLSPMATPRRYLIRASCAVAGVGVYLTLMALLGGALGWIIRSTAGAIGALVALLLVVPSLVPLLPGSLGTTISQYLPSTAGEAFIGSVRTDDMLAPWTGLGVLALWVTGALVAAAIVLRRRDA